MSRSITDGFHWIQYCQPSSTGQRKIEERNPQWYRKGYNIHGNRNAFLFVDEYSLLWDTLSPMATEHILNQLDILLEGKELDYLFISHTDTPHCANTNIILEEYPNCTLLAPSVGQPAELYYLDEANEMDSGNRVNLGKFDIEVCEAYFMDAPKSVWIFEHNTKSLLTSDWMSFRHHESECRQFVDELLWELTVDNFLEFHERVFFYLEYVDLAKAYSTIDEIKQRFKPEIIAPPHSLVIRKDAIDYLEKMKEVTKQLASRSDAREKVW